MSDIFTVPSAKTLEKELNIIEIARQDGKNSIPGIRQAGLCESEKNIRNHIINITISDIQKQAQQVLSRQHEERSKLKIRESLVRIKTCPNDVSAGLEQIERNAIDNIAACKEDAFKASTNLKLFKAENKLNREPHYPPSKHLHKAFILIVILVETILNSFLLAQGNEFGFVGGLASAAIISSLNVSFSFLAGTYVLPQVFHISPSRKVLGYFFLSIYVSVVSAYCLLVGHYREEIGGDYLDAAHRAFLSFQESMLGIEDFNAWVLVGISAAISIVVTIKFLTADDIYPGFGDVDRKMVLANKKFNKMKSKFDDEGHSIIKNGEDSIHNLHTAADQNVANYRISLNDSEQVLKTYKECCVEVNNLYETIINRYRTVNHEIRAIENPKYWDDKISLPEDMLPVLNTFKFDEDKDSFTKIESEYASLPEIFKESLSHIQKFKSEHTKWMESIIEHAIEEANSKVTGNSR
jgi:hypothetical protein